MSYERGLLGKVLKVTIEELKPSKFHEMNYRDFPVLH